MYDLRFTSNRIDKHPQPTRPDHNSATPFMEFSDVECDRFRNVDLCHELGLVACGLSSHARYYKKLTLTDGWQHPNYQPSNSSPSQQGTGFSLIAQWIRRNYQ